MEFCLVQGRGSGIELEWNESDRKQGFLTCADQEGKVFQN